MARTFAMRVYAATYWVLTLSFLYILVAALGPAVSEDPELAAIMPVLVVFLGLFVVAAATTACREMVAGGAAAWGSARTRWAIGIAAAVTVGASVTGYVGAAHGDGGGAAIAAAPTTSATLVAEGTKFLTTSYSMSSSDVLGLFVENRDSSAHSFDIDALDIHVQVPPGATVALAVKPAKAGPIEFTCAIPGHREAGMVGTIDVR